MRGGSTKSRGLSAKAALRTALRAKIKRDGYLEFGLEGRCMEPLLVEGDKARIVERDKYVSGDICLIETTEGAVSLHRLIAVQGSLVASKGDRAGCCELVDESSILGVVESLCLKDSFGWAPFEQGFFSKQLSVLLSRALCVRGSRDFRLAGGGYRIKEMRHKLRSAARMLQRGHASRVRKKAIRRSYRATMLEQKKDT